jgi:hypothetical protein
VQQIHRKFELGKLLENDQLKKDADGTEDYLEGGL